MGRFNAPFVSFNGGEIGKEVQGRTTIEGYGATASTLENILPEGAGPMTFRRGFGFQVESPTPGSYTHIYPFVYRLNQKYLMMFTEDALRIVENGGIVTRPAVASDAVANPGFTGSLAGWTDYSTGGSSATSVSDALVLYCDGPNPAGVRQSIATSSVDTEHHLEVEVLRGPVVLRIGTSIGGEELLSIAELRTGTHRLAFTPTMSPFYLDISSSVRRNTIVDSVQLASAGGDIVLVTPWAAADLRGLRMRQDLNVMYVADGVRRRHRIERRGASSWSLTESDEKDGPFLAPNLDETITVTPSTRVGNGTMTSSKPVFKSTDVKRLWQLTQNGQYVSRTIIDADQWTTPAVKVTGVGTARDVTWTATGTFSGTVRLQRSIGNDSTWEDVTGGTGSFDTVDTPGTFAFNDGQDNVITYYRVGTKAGEFASGSVDVTLFFPGGATVGIVRITEVNSNTSVDIEVLTALGALTATSEWAAGSWSDAEGWPKGVTVFDGRLWSGFADRFWGSVSDGYESQKAGDLVADAIARSIAVGEQAPHISWMMGLSRLVVGCEGSEVVIRSNSLDDPLSTTSMTVREMSTFGAADLQPVKIDTRGIYIERSGARPMELYSDPNVADYVARPLTRLHRDIGRLGIVQLAVARQPESRLLMVRADGQLLVKLFDPGENTLGWSRVFTPGASGRIESVAVLPGGNGEDEIYVMVKRTIMEAETRYLEKLDPIYIASASDANCLDSYLRYESGGAVNVPANYLDHLEGETVKVWADGAYMGENAVSSGILAEPLSSTKEAITVGLDYTGRYRSSKLALGAKAGTAIAQRGRPAGIHLLLLDTVTSGIRMGGNFAADDSDNPMVGIDEYLGGENADEGEATVYDSGPGLIDVTTNTIPLPNASSNDPRMCIEFRAPFPVTLQGYTISHHLDEVVRA